MAAADAPVGASATLRSHLGVDLLVATATGVFSMAAAAVVFGIRPGDVGRFWGAGGDMTPVIGVVKGAVEGHDLTINRDLGYPGFMDSAQFPLLTDGLHWLQVLLLGRVTGDAVLAVNTYALLGFFQVAFAAYLLLRFLSVDRALAAVLSAALSLIPWHFERAPSHIWLANFAPMIVGIGLALAVNRGAFDRANAARRLVWALPLAALVGFGGVYYAFLTSVLLVAVLAARLVGWRARAPRWPTFTVVASVPLLAAASILGNEGLQHAPTITAVTERFPSESTVYAGTLATMFLPDHRSVVGEALLGVRPSLVELYSWSGGTAAFNVVVIACLAVTLGLLLVSLLTRWTETLPGRAAAPIGDLVALLLITCFLFATQAAGSLFAHLVTPEIRAWGRFSVAVATLGVCAAGVVMTAWMARNRRAGLLRVVLSVGIGAVLALETFSLTFQRDPESLALESELRPFVATLEAALPEGCPILQVPLMEYPEAAPINGLGGYSLMLPYLVGEDLRWSYGGMKGTAEGRWGLELRDDLPRLVGEAQEVGFCGALLDTASLGEDRQLEDYTTVLGVPDAVSEGQRWVFFEWDDVGTPPVVVTPNGGFSGPESDGADTFWWQVARQGELSVRGLGRSDAWVTLVVGAPPCGPQAVRINGRPHVVRGARQEVRVPVKRDSAGVAGIEVIGSGDPCRVAGDSRPLRPRVFQVRQVDGLESASTSP